MDKLVRQLKADRRSVKNDPTAIVDPCVTHYAKRYFVHDGVTQRMFVTHSENFNRKGIGKIHEPIIEVSLFKMDLMMVMYFTRSAARCNGRIGEDYSFLEITSMRSYDELLAYIVGGRKYNEYKNNIFIAATKWKFASPSDCVVVCHK